MNTIVAYPDNLSFSNGKYHHSSDNYKQTNTFSNLNEFDSLSQKDTLIYLVPSSIISSYVFENNQNLSKQNNLANFISDIDSFIVDDISKNKFFIFNLASLMFLTKSMSLKSLSITLGNSIKYYSQSDDS